MCCDIEKSKCSAPSLLLKHAVNLIMFFEIKHLGGVIWIYTLSIKKKPKCTDRHTLSLGVCCKNLFHPRCLLYFEKCFLPSLILDPNSDSAGLIAATLWFGGLLPLSWFGRFISLTLHFRSKLLSF
ncbi:unnamed protein product, partial [Heterosigma akashiwo]